MAQIRVENLRKAFDQFTAVQDSNFTIERRDLLCLARPFRLRQDDDAAHDRRSRTSHRRPHLARRGGRHLPPRGGARHRLRLPAVRALSAYECRAEHRLSAQMPGHAASRDPRAGAAKPRGCLRIEHLLASKTSKLSGGDRQRVALGRAMVRRPKAFLMDEPLGALDAEFRQLMCGELRDLHDRISRDYDLRHARSA